MIQVLRTSILFLLLAAVQLSVAQTAALRQDAVYQYAVSTVGQRTVYLWVPPHCNRVRGLMMAFANLTERQWLEDATVRTALADGCLGEAWIGPGDEALFNAELKPGSDAILRKLFQDLARVSGHAELETAPVIPTGHSAHGPFAWRFAEWAPERTIAAIAIKTLPIPDDLKIAGIPFFYIVGETTEWPQYRDGSRPGDRDFFWPVVQQTARALRKADARNLVAVATEPGGGHFDWSKQDSRLLALYLRKACVYRLPVKTGKSGTGNGPVALHPAPTGWLIGSEGLRPDRWPSAPQDRFAGPQDQGYWLFDRELAEAVTRFAGDRKRRKRQMLTVRQDGQLLPVATTGFAAPRFVPEEDGLSFRLTPDHLTALPPELLGAGTLLGHGTRPIRFQVLTGPAEQLDAHRFRVAIKRATASGDIWIEETQAGDAVYRKAVQPIRVRIPLRRTEGASQSIAFAPLADRRSTQPMLLAATASSGLPVQFYVDYGPAVVIGSHLCLREVPLHRTQPIEVRVVATQWGRSAGAWGKAVASAEPVTRSFLLLP